MDAFSNLEGITEALPIVNEKQYIEIARITTKSNLGIKEIDLNAISTESNYEIKYEENKVDFIFDLKKRFIASVFKNGTCYIFGNNLEIINEFWKEIKNEIHRINHKTEKNNGDDFPVISHILSRGSIGRKIDVEKVLKNSIYESNRLKETEITKMTLQVNGKKQNVAFFENGNCIITGAQSFEENQKVWETFIHEIERIESLIN